MRIAVTGGTGFIGRYLLHKFVSEGHRVNAWHRASSDRSGLESLEGNVSWIPGDLGGEQDAERLVDGCDAVVHAALYHPGGGFRGGEGDLISFCQTNIIGSLRLIEAARRAGAERFVFISTCAVHEKILEDRPLDETHPTWARSHYGAHKAAIEQFVYSFGLGHDYPICALRPTGVYGVAHPAQSSKWFDLVARVARGESVNCRGGGKEVHAADVAKAASLLLTAPVQEICGEVFNCCDRYVSNFEVAELAKRLSGAAGEVHGEPSRPKNTIRTDKIERLGMQFGGTSRLEETLGELVKVQPS